jgi:DNA gyrase subunit A
MIDDPEIDLERLMEIMPGPDFPTGGIILGRMVSAAPTTGRGSVVMRSRVSIEEVRKDREALVITEIPYQVNKSSMIEKIAELVRDKRIEGISDIRDESDRDGIRVVIELKRDAMADVVLNQLYRSRSCNRASAATWWRSTAASPSMMTLRTCSMPSSASAKRSSPAAPSSCSPRRATERMFWPALRLLWPISTR